MKNQLISIALLFLCALPLAGTGAHAAMQTPPGTEIKNWAAVTYSVNSVPYPEKVSNVVAFTVLELIDATVVWQDSANVAVEPGTSKAVTTFQLTSTGNGSESFALAVDTSLIGDDFNPAFVSLYLDANGDSTFDASLDTLYIPGVNDPSLAPLGSVTVFALCDIPTGLSTATVGQLLLTATARSGFGDKGEILPNLGDTGVDAMLGLSGGQARDTGAYQATVSEYPLTLTKCGEGSVSSSPAGISCGSGCAGQVASYLLDSTVTLTATSAVGNVFAGWSGACSGSGVICSVVMSAARNVTATFVGMNIPVGSIIINNDDEWTASPAATLTLAANDDQGIVGWFVSESPNPPAMSDPNWQSVASVPSFAAAVPFTLSDGDGVKTVYAWYRDADANVSFIASDAIKLDTTPPSSAANPPGGTFAGSVTVALSCDDGQGIGCATVYYSIDASIPTAASPVYNGSLTFFYTTTLTFFSVDKLGNSEVVHSEIYVIEAPEITSEVRTHQSSSFAYPVGEEIPDVNLRHIPGSYHQVIIRSTNKRTDPLDNVEVVVPIPALPKYCVDAAKSGVERYLILAEGTPPSGLTLSSVTFSKDAGVSYGYTPVGDGDNCDDAVTHLKARLSGSFNASDGSRDPYFELIFIGYVK